MEIGYILFFIIILLANIVQGITGFAGTILAMPFALLLVGYDIAKPILNVLGLLSGIYVFLYNKDKVNWKELKKIVVIMAVGILAGIGLKGFFAESEDLLYKLLGAFVVFLGVQGLYKSLKSEKEDAQETQEIQEVLVESEELKSEEKPQTILLILAGIVHGIFVAGGPLLIGYLSKIIKDKMEFRATISTVWIFLNTIILFDDLRLGLWNFDLFTTLAIAVPFLFVGMKIGTILYHKMSQALFMKITYILLMISGVSLFI